MQTNRTLHIISGLSAAGTMKIFLKSIDSNDKIAVWNDPLMYGPLFKDFSDNELKRRARYLNTFFGYNGYDLYPSMHNIIHYDFSRHERIVVWYGNGVDELLLLYMICSLTGERLFAANICELYELFPHYKTLPFPLALAHCSPDNARIMYDRIKPISEEEKAEYKSNWNRWAGSNAPLRLKGADNTIFEAGEDYFDSLILSKCSTEYTKAARIIGGVLGDLDQLIGDGFLSQRIIQLTRQQKLQVCNNKEFKDEIEKSNNTDPNKICINGVNVSQMRFFFVKLN